MSISSILVEQGRLQAEAKRRQGEQRAALVSQLGQIPATIIADRQAARLQQQRQQAEAQRAALQTEELKARTGQIADERTKAATEARKQTELDEILGDPGVTNAETGEISFGNALKRAQTLGYKGHALTLEKLAKDTAAAKPKAPEPFTLNPGDVRFGPDGQQVANNPRIVEPKAEPNPTESSLALAAANGNPSAIKALEILRRPSGPQGPQPGWQWVTRAGADGKPKEVYTNKVQDGDKPQNARVKATEDERKTAGFYVQMKDAIGTIDQLEKQLTEAELYQMQTLPQEKLVGMVNRGQMSEAAKRYLRAFEQFTESRLRPVSGAAIADGEYARDRRTYARQYSETPTLAEDRKRARGLALDSLKKRAGVALDDAGGGQSDPLGIR